MKIDTSHKRQGQRFLPKQTCPLQGDVNMSLEKELGDKLVSVSVMA